MKYSCTKEVKICREEYAKLRLDESQYDEWQDGFQSTHGTGIGYP